MIKLIKIQRLKNHRKKFKAIFNVNGKRKTTYFGATGYQDYTMHKDKKRRDNYLQRHLKDLQTNDPTRAGFLSMYILWGQSTNLQKNGAEYKKKLKHFNLTGKWDKTIPGTIIKGGRKSGNINRKLKLKLKINKRKSYTPPTPSNPRLYSKIKSEAKRKFRVWPSAYASSWLVKEYKRRGGEVSREKGDETPRALAQGAVGECLRTG